MRGHGCDNGFNMKGKHAGVQKRLHDLNSRAFFVPCGNHLLNLVVNDATLSCSIAVDCFEIIQEIFNLFSFSTHRWSILVKHASTLTVKPLNNTRCESRIEALLPSRYQIKELYDAVYEASQDVKIDAFGRNTALGIAKKLQSFKFLCCIITWYEILFKINMVNKALQKVTSDLPSSMDLVKSVHRFLDNVRSEEGLNNVITDVKELADKSVLLPKTLVRPRKIKRDFSYEIEDEPVQAGRTSFKVNFFLVVLDTALSLLEERFELMENHSKSFKFLHDIENLQTRDRKELKDACTHFHSVLSDGDECDINGIELFDELQIFENQCFPLEALQLKPCHS
ncbi:hypothetical protein PR048_015177 [Dryococelus australis]|uniref:Zinc finger MYM-type 1-like protein n=1 Tax=Dryococelus australis TaxID=614101 RepID=A0ABQ9HG89_9NEOP|nr:hypothetical protein PR048_015177 [Dryococelus australis]